MHLNHLDGAQQRPQDVGDRVTGQHREERARGRPQARGMQGSEASRGGYEEDLKE